MTALRLVIRSHRFEVVGAGIFAIAAIGVAAGLAFRLAAFGIPTGCFTDGPTSSLPCAVRQLDVTDYLTLAGDWGYRALAATVLLPVMSGLLLGVALVGKEIDRGTTAFAWAIAPSRRRWLLLRVVPIGLLVVGASLAAGLLADQLELLRAPGTDPQRSFEHLGVRGPVLAAEALAIFGLALLVGSVLGRVLPALLLAGALSLGAYVGVTVAMDAMLAHETVLVLGVDGGAPGRVLDYLVQAPDGQFLTWSEVYARYGDPGSPDFVDPGLRTVLRVNPGELYPIVVARMTLIYGALGLASIVLAFAVVERRRP